jgi:hypothetical protein
MLGTTTFDLGAMTGAIVGAGVSVAGSISVAHYLDREQDRRKMRTAIGLVRSEMEENANRIEAAHGDPPLTLGVWAESREALGDLALRSDTEPLWRDLLRLYSVIYESVRGHGAPPVPSELRSAASKLAVEQEAIANELRYGWLRRMARAGRRRRRERRTARG